MQDVNSCSTAAFVALVELEPSTTLLTHPRQVWNDLIKVEVQHTDVGQSDVFVLFAMGLQTGLHCDGIVVCLLLMEAPNNAKMASALYGPGSMV